jgi:hypothetical protein
MKENEWVALGGLIGTQLLRKALTKGANLPTPPAPAVNFIKADGTTQAVDNRVKIEVPPDYYYSPVMSGITGLSDSGTGGGTANVQVTGLGGSMTVGADRTNPVGIGMMKGIIFPYTPSIQFEHKATYASQTPTHSNFTQYFYQHSSVSPIVISGKFSVENDNDAMFLLMTIHLLKSLTKMRQGSDTNAGAPPPVCTLKGYGNFMLDGIPVVITSFKHELPDSVDYFTAYKNSDPAPAVWFKNNAVPVVSSITVTCNPIYSRSQISRFSPQSWIEGKYTQGGQSEGYQ